MSQEIIRCPYCVLDSEFRPMFGESTNVFVCATCGHTTIPDEPHEKCPCARCRQMNLAANRMTRERPVLTQAANS